MYSFSCILYSLVEDSSDCIPRYSPEFPWLSKYTARGHNDAILPEGCHYAILPEGWPCTLKGPVVRIV
jgi:hypothetical protein